MVIECKRKELFDAMDRVSCAISNRTSLSVMKHVLMETVDNDHVKLSAGDLELFVSITIPASVRQTGACTMEAKRGSELIGSLVGNEVLLDTKRGFAVHVACENSRYVLAGLDPASYPSLPEVTDEISFTVPQRTLREMIKQTAFAMSKDYARANIACTLFDLEESKLTLVATDSFRLACRSESVTDSSGSAQSLVPARAITELIKLLEDAPGDVRVSATSSQIRFSMPNDITFISRLVDGKYIGYKRVIPESASIKLKTPRRELLDAVRRAEIVASRVSHRVTFQWNESTLVVTANETDGGSARELVDGSYGSGTDVNVAFNALYLSDALKAMDGQFVEFQMDDPERTVVLRPVDEKDKPAPDYLCIVMPMKSF
jgi:DNA polymerase-3 subunit beta